MGTRSLPSSLRLHIHTTARRPQQPKINPLPVPHPFPGALTLSKVQTLAAEIDHTMFPVSKSKQPRRSYGAASVAGAGSSTARQLKASEPVFPSAGIDSASEERDWTQLLPDVVRKIGDGLLRDDVTEYIRLRAVCQPWRRATGDPSALEPRFFPRNWVLLVPAHYKLRSDGAAERFVNVRTGASLRIRLPTPEEYTHHGNTEGLLILWHRDTDTVCLLNPLTMAFTDLPAMSAIDRGRSSARLAEWDIKAAGVLVEVDEQGHARSLEPPNVVLSLTLGTRTVLLYARPRDFVWRLVDTSCTDELEGKLPTIKGGLAVWGSFYIPTRAGDVLRVVLEPRPHLIFVARQTGSSVCSGLSESSYIVSSGADIDSKDGMLLVRKKRGIRPVYRWWDVDLRNRRLIRMTTLIDRTVMLPSITLCSSTFPDILQNQVCSKNYTRSFLLGNII